jgi:hypothetical protein
MKPHRIVALCAFVDAALQLYPFLFGYTGSFSITGFFGLFIAVSLLWRDKFSFQAYRFYLWVVLLTMIFFLLASFFGWKSALSGKFLLFPYTYFPPVLCYFIWLVIAGALLSYTGTNKVRRAFRLPKKVTDPAQTEQPEEQIIP